MNLLSNVSTPVSSANSSAIVSLSGRNRTSRLSSAAAKTSSFLANLHPTRWRRWNSGTPSIISSNNNGISSRSSLLLSQSQDQLGSFSSASSLRSPVNSGNKDKIKAWIKEHAKNFIRKYFDNEDSNDENNHPAMSTLNRINAAIDILDKGRDIEALSEIRCVISDGDISPFELIHCGVIRKLMHYLTHTLDGEEARDKRIRKFLHVFIGSPVDTSTVMDYSYEMSINASPFSSLVVKLNACVSQLEQFPVRVSEVIGTGAGVGEWLGRAGPVD